MLPQRPELLETLAAFEAEAEDRENDLCDERDEGEEDDSASDLEKVDEDGVNESFGMDPSEPMKGAKKPYEAFAADPERRDAEHQRAAWREAAKVARQAGASMSMFGSQYRRRW